MKKFGTAAILAGGKSSRMGFDKQFLEINEQRLIDGVREKLSQDFDEIIVVTNKKEKYIGFNDQIIGDIIPGKGPLSGIHAGLMAASSQYVYFIACDMPHICLDYIRYMKSEIEALRVKACITKFQGHIEPFNAFYAKDMIEDIESCLGKGKRSVNALLTNLEIHEIEEEKAREFSPNWDMFLNLNTKEELDEFLAKGIVDRSWKVCYD